MKDFLKELSLYLTTSRKRSYSNGPRTEKKVSRISKMLCAGIPYNNTLILKSLILTTHAFDYAIREVLSQSKIGEDRSIAYMSSLKKPAEVNYTTTEKECLAIIYAILYFWPYLYGREFTLKSSKMD